MSTRFNFYIKITLFIFALAVLIICTTVFRQHYIQLIAWIHELGWLAPILFLILYTLTSLMFLPTMILTLAGGALFGPVMGTILNLIGATLGAGFSFLITRHLVQDWFTRNCGEKLNQLITGIEQKGWMFVAFLRLFPIVPFNVVNYGLGITDISFKIYIITSFIFLIPAEVIYTYCGYAGMNVLSDPVHFYRNGGIILSVLVFVVVCVLRLFKTKDS